LNSEFLKDNDYNKDYDDNDDNDNDDNNKTSTPEDYDQIIVNLSTKLQGLSLINGTLFSGEEDYDSWISVMNSFRDSYQWNANQFNIFLQKHLRALKFYLTMLKKNKDIPTLLKMMQTCFVSQEDDVRLLSREIRNIRYRVGNSLEDYGNEIKMLTFRLDGNASDDTLVYISILLFILMLMDYLLN